MQSRILAWIAAIGAVVALSSCGSGGTTTPGVYQPQFYLIVNNDGSITASSTSINFYSNIAAAGTPHFSESDGSSFDGGPLTGSQCIVHAGESSCGEYAAITGQHAHTTYTVTFPAVTLSNPDPNGRTSFTNVNAGSFTTQ